MVWYDLFRSKTPRIATTASIKNVSGGNKYGLFPLPFFPPRSFSDPSDVRNRGIYPICSGKPYMYGETSNIYSI